jgi:Cu/Ag efflux pump CusA
MMWLVRIALRFPQPFFSPLAMAVVFTMVASYLLPRTVVPTIVKYLWKT